MTVRAGKISTELLVITEITLPGNHARNEGKSYTIVKIVGNVFFHLFAHAKGAVNLLASECNASDLQHILQAICVRKSAKAQYFTAVRTQPPTRPAHLWEHFHLLLLQLSARGPNSNIAYTP